MNIDEQLSLGPLFLTDRKCRKCGAVKNLIDGFYKKGSGMNPSSYSYVCKTCTINKVITKRKSKDKKCDWSYPDW